MDQEDAERVVELSKSLIEFMREYEPSWERAYVRFSSEGSKHGSNGSYVVGSKVTLFDPFKSGDFFRTFNSLALKHLSRLRKENGVLLLSADSQFNYEIKYEFEDMGRWLITKINGGTGIPMGI